MFSWSLNFILIQSISSSLIQFLHFSGIVYFTISNINYSTNSRLNYPSTHKQQFTSFLEAFFYFLNPFLHLLLLLSSFFWISTLPETYFHQMSKIYKPPTPKRPKTTSNPRRRPILQFQAPLLPKFFFFFFLPLQSRKHQLPSLNYPKTSKNHFKTTPKQPSSLLLHPKFP